MAVAFPAPQAARGSALGVLRFITCGSVDDGKSTLIGRLLHDTGQIAEDQLATLHADSGRYGTTGSEPDLALLVDGLESEREQGITIDVAHRYFDTPRRKFILADTPGHEQYTRNMATGASGADLAILLVDASKGVQVQTRRHARIVALLGVRHLVVAVNKMDLVGYQPSVFQKIVEECEGFLSQLPGTVRSFVPLSALSGCNVVCRGAALGWYTGPTLLELLESVDVQGGLQEGDLRLPVQYVNRPHAGFRGYAGTVAAGRIAVGDAVIALPGRSASRVQSIVTFDGPRREAVAGMSITITLEDDIDVGRGFVFAHPGRTPVMAREFEAHVVWMGDTPLLPGRQYDLKFAHRYVRGTVARIEHRVDVQTYETLSATELALNDVALCRFVTTEPVAIDPYEVEKTTGSLIVIDPLTHATVGAALIRRPVGTASVNLSWHTTRVSRGQRANQKGQRPCVLWFTGLSGSGKSTIANSLEATLFRHGYHGMLLDGDNVRHGLSADLGFSREDRRENIRRLAEVSRLMTEAGLIVATAFISPYRDDRALARKILGEDFIEVHVATSLEECERRDPKGLYARARRGEINGFTGLDAPYEAPESAEIVLDTSRLGVQGAVREILLYLERTGRLLGAAAGSLAVAEDDWEI